MPYGEDNSWMFSNRDVEITDSILGRGAFGEVRVGKWRGIDVACKKLHVNDAATAAAGQGTEIALETFLQEISMLSTLRHPNLVLFIGVCESNQVDGTVLLTELMSCSLYDLLEVQKIRLTLPDILDISIDIARGLHYLHQRSPPIVHRDISCKNILIGGSGGGVAKIADLGQAKIFGQSVLSRQTALPGAMAYAAPEVLTGRYSEKIDVFSFGILLVQMCSSEYPRIDRRDEQIERATVAFPVLQEIVTRSVKFLPTERGSTREILSGLEEIKGNGRFYPIARLSAPEKDLGIIARSWMGREIEERCREMQVKLQQTEGRLAAGENRWLEEAGKVDGLNERIQELETALHRKSSELDVSMAKGVDFEEQLKNVRDDLASMELRMGRTQSENVRLSTKMRDYEVKLAMAASELEQWQGEVNSQREYSQQCEEALLASRETEKKSIEAAAQLRMQLEMQVHYNVELENRLQQALSRWNAERDARAKEKEQAKRQTALQAQLASKCEHLAADVQRYENRLSKYDDLPLPEEIKARVNDLQSELQRSAEEYRTLLRQKEEVDEEVLRRESTIDALDRQINDQKLQLLTQEDELRSQKDALLAVGKKLDQKRRAFQELLDDNIALKEEQQRAAEQQRELEGRLQEAIEEAAVSRRIAEMARRHQQQQSTPKNNSSNNNRTTTTNINNMNNNSGSVNIADVVSGGDVVDGVGSIGVEEGQVEESGRAEGNEKGVLDDVTSTGSQDPAAAVIDGLTSTELPPLKIPEVAIKVHLQQAVDEDGAAGALRFMREPSHIEDERVVWRCARALRETVLKDPDARTLCVNEHVDRDMLAAARRFPYIAAVQAQCIRLLGALAFGNDFVRRRAGEAGAMAQLAEALHRHPHDEPVQLHVCTAITNLVHNSFENRSRFADAGGIELLLSAMEQYAQESKFQRQACWALLTLAGSEPIARVIAQLAGESLVLAAMLTHRFDPGVQQFGCWALVNLTLAGSDVAEKLQAKGAVEVCRIALETHGSNLEVVRQARNLLSLLPAASSSPATPPATGARRITVSSNAREKSGSVSLTATLKVGRIGPGKGAAAAGAPVKGSVIGAARQQG